MLDALATLGTEPLRFGIDTGEHAQHLALTELMNIVLNDLELGAKESAELSARLDTLVNEPDNLIALSSYGYSTEVYAEVEKLLAKMDLSEFIGNTRIPFSGFLSAFNDVVGFNDPNSPLFAVTKGLLVPLETQINNAKQAVTAQGDKAVRSMLSLRFRLLNRLMKLPGLSAQRSAAMSVWGQAQFSDGKVVLNQDFSAQAKSMNARYHQLLMEAQSTNAAMAGLVIGSREHTKLSKTLRGLDKQIARYIESMPVLFSEYESKAIGKYSFANAVNKIDSKFDSIGRMDFVVAALNAINVVSQMVALQEAVASAPNPDTRRQEMTLGYSTAWMINATGATIKGIALNEIKSQSARFALMDNTIQVLKSGCVKNISTAQILTVERYLTHSLIAGVAGVMAAGLEGWQTMEDFIDSKSSSERWLLVAKTSALGMQAFSWGGLAYQTLRARVGGLLIGQVLQGWMLSLNFWGAALYAVVTIVQLVTQKTPLEKWLNHSIWGKEPDPGLSAEDEYHDLIKLINQPSMHTRPIRRVMPQEHSMNAITVGFEQSITVVVPNAYPGEVVTLGIGAGYALSDYRSFTPAELASGQWLQDPKEPTLYQYRLPLPRLVNVVVAQGQGIIKQERINVFVARQDDNPYSDSDKLASLYQAQTLAGASEHKEMVENETLSLSQNDKVQLEVPQ
ncbi:hypothetical protein [uncultured Photobacterium sp.]|uniref:hypothetical protein n=1 Tax=uncultured Photobacterium sp. TaxID=173973 RepID=UPI002615F968|nr:hypothetical protein [uncultured Photobacterium sp.]